jgi:hypothetical protein
MTGGASGELKQMVDVYKLSRANSWILVGI